MKSLSTIFFAIFFLTSCYSSISNSSPETELIGFLEHMYIEGDLHNAATYLNEESYESINLEKLNQEVDDFEVEVVRSYTDYELGTSTVTVRIKGQVNGEYKAIIRSYYLERTMMKWEVNLLMT